jgi:HTH-type transcriptional regulator / antitoxin HipB
VIESKMDTISEQTREFGANVRALRKQLGITQIELGLLAGCGPVFVRHLEGGKPTVRLDKTISVLNALGQRLTTEPNK